MQAMQPVDVPAVSDAISDQILKLIASGELKTGDPLPPQRELARQLGVSLSSLRESLHALSAVGVIQVKHGCGTFVSDHMGDALYQHLDWPRLLQGNETRELMEARGVVDVAVASMAAQRATQAQIEQLQHTLHAMQVCFRRNDIARLQELDMALHLGIAAASGNSLVQRLASSVYSVAEQFMRIVPHTRIGMENHRRVIDAIARHDSAAAEAAVRTLLQETERLYRKANPN